MKLSLSDKTDIVNSALVLRQWKNTQDPFIVAEAMGIAVKYIDVGLSIMKGSIYYSGKANIELKINSNISNKEQKSVCAHELGHFILKHTGKNYYKDNNLEREYCANLFAVSFLYLYNRYKCKNDIINLTNYALQTILDIG